MFFLFKEHKNPAAQSARLVFMALAPRGKGDRHHKARLQGGRLAGAGYPVALHSGFGFGDC